MAQIPMDNAPGQFYTVEARSGWGTTTVIPGEAVVLHQVDPNVSGTVCLSRPKWWTATAMATRTTPAPCGRRVRRLADAANGITVTVNAQTATGFQVTIKRGAAGAWVSRASMPTARRALAVAVANGSLYAIGGANGSGTVLRTVQAYNPSPQRVDHQGVAPRASAGRQRCRHDQRDRVPGRREDAAGALTRTLYAYNASTNVWSTRASMPAYGACGGSAVIAGRIYVFSGCTRSSTGARINAGLLHRYNPTTNTWTTLKTAPVTHFRPVVGAIGGKAIRGGRKQRLGHRHATGRHV